MPWRRWFNTEALNSRRRARRLWTTSHLPVRCVRRWQDPYTLNLEVEVESRGGSISIRGDCAEETEAIQRVVGAVAGVTGLTVDAVAVPAAN